MADDTLTFAQALALADQHMAAGRLSVAEGLCRRVLFADPAQAPALHLLGLIAARTGDLPAAVVFVRRATEADSHAALYFCDLSELCRRAGALDEAMAAGERALVIAPDSPRALNNLGIVHFERGGFDEAVACYRRALALAPDFAQGHSNLGNALRALRQLDSAIAAYRRAIAIDPHFADAWSNLGSALNVLGRRDEALDAYDRAITCDPLHGGGHTGRALQLLLRGDFDAGWYEYEWRWRSNELPTRPLAGQGWLGDAIAGRRVLVHAEQGLGDTIQFARYATLLLDRGASVVLRVQRPLVRLLDSSLPGVEIIADDEPPPTCDVQCALLSLPLLFATRPETIPADGPYLRAPQAEVARWRELIAGPGRLVVGVAWAGNPKHNNDHNRSIAFERLRPLLAVKDIRWISLQVGPRAADLARAEPPGLFDAGSRIDDFLDTAAVIAGLDLVICVDSAVAHLAGALGRPAWVLLPVGADWRWFMRREDSPWHPTLRLLRQGVYGQWAPVVARAAGDLQALVGAQP